MGGRGIVKSAARTLKSGTMHVCLARTHTNSPGCEPEKQNVEVPSARARFSWHTMCCWSWLHQYFKGITHVCLCVYVSARVYVCRCVCVAQSTLTDQGLKCACWLLVCCGYLSNLKQICIAARVCMCLRACMCVSVRAQIGVFVLRSRF